MPVATVELIVFGIQAGLQLVQAGRRIYVEATIEGEVDIPLPTALAGTTLDRAVRYARALSVGTPQEKARFKANYRAALEAADDDTQPAGQRARWELVSQYVSDVRAGAVPDAAAAFAPRVAVLTVRQFAAGRSPFPNPVQRVAGTLIDIAVDYFATMPGAISEHSKQGKAVRQFLLGLSSVEFADARIDQIVVALFSSALDTLKDNPQLIVQDDDEQALLTTIVGGIVQDVTDRLAAAPQGDLDAEDNLKRYGQVVLASLLRNAGQAIVDDPAVLGLKRGGKAMVQSIGSALLQLLLDGDDDDLAAGLLRIASTKGLDQLVTAAMKAVIEHPDFFGTGNAAVDKWLTDVLRGLYDRAGADDSFFDDPALFADVAYLAIEYGLRDLPVLMKTGSSSAGLLTDVARAVFEVLAVEVPVGAGKSARWKLLSLSRSDLKDLFASIFAAIVMHNEYLVRRRDVQKSAIAVVPLVIEVLCGLIDDDGVGHLKPLLRSAHLHEVIAAVLASEIIKPASPPDAAKVVAGLKALLDAIWDSGATGGERLLDDDVLLDLLIATSRSGVATKLFGGKAAEIGQAVDALLPIVTRLRQGETIPIDAMAAAMEG